MAAGPWCSLLEIKLDCVRLEVLSCNRVVLNLEFYSVL
jgi:hypothetical protein